MSNGLEADTLPSPNILTCNLTPSSIVTADGMVILALFVDMMKGFKERDWMMIL